MTSIQLYADYGKLHSNIDSTDQLQNCLTDLHNWLMINNLLLNSTKTGLINIPTAKIKPELAFPKIFINDLPIKPDSTKYLGIEFDNKLNFDQLILSLKQTTTYHLYNLYKLPTYINRNTVTLHIR